MPSTNEKIYWNAIRRTKERLKAAKNNLSAGMTEREKRLEELYLRAGRIAPSAGMDLKRIHLLENELRELQNLTPDEYVASLLEG
ncbi:hypothetical protein EBT11_07385 [bacterium]|nr:hypothetical protein [bacterium]